MAVSYKKLWKLLIDKAYKRFGLSSDKERLRIMTDSLFGFGYKAGFMITATADKISNAYKLVIESTFYDVPIWEKYTLTIKEASKYFRIGENKMRKLAEENLSSNRVLLNGNRIQIQIKRKQFEKVIDALDTI